MHESSHPPSKTSTDPHSIFKDEETESERIKTLDNVLQ